MTSTSVGRPITALSGGTCEPCRHWQMKITLLSKTGQNEYIFRCKHPDTWASHFRSPTARERAIGRIIYRGNVCFIPRWCPLLAPLKETK